MVCFDQVNILTHTADVKTPTWQSRIIKKLKKYEVEDMRELYGQDIKAAGSRGRKRRKCPIGNAVDPKIPEKEEDIRGRDSTLLGSQGKEEKLDAKACVQEFSESNRKYIRFKCE
jgi:hypothetical protein